MLATLLVAGCTTPADDLVLPVRNPTAPVASQADVTIDRLAGRWRVVEAYPDQAPRIVIIGEGAVRLDTNDPVSAGLIGPGRLQVGDAVWWVHWLDVDNRTAAIGDPDGDFVWIMDRTPASSPDRLAAARDVLGWYGYDLTRIEVF